MDYTAAPYNQLRYHLAYHIDNGLLKFILFIWRRTCHMANTEHLTILHQGAKIWNQWRKDNHGVIPDLSDTELGGINLERTNLIKANFN